MRPAWRGGQLASVVRAGGHEVIAFTRVDARHHEGRSGSRRRSRVRGRTSSSTAPAYNDVDGAEEHAVDALNINAFAVRALARAAAACGAALVHFSTDFVFDGKATRAVYRSGRAESAKALCRLEAAGRMVCAGGASRVRAACGESVRWRARRTAGQRQRRGDCEARFSRAAMLACSKTARFHRPMSSTSRRRRANCSSKAAEPGIYHCVNSGSCTWLDLARELARQLGVEPRLAPIRMADAKLRAARPLYSALSNAKLASVGVSMPDWSEAIARYVASLRA